MIASVFALLLLAGTAEAQDNISLSIEKHAQLTFDGAVIITENALRHLAEKQHALGRTLDTEERLQTVRASAEEMIKPSLYGQAIIILVYVPLLTFTGVEGKMFQPMALTVIIALVAIITYYGSTSENPLTGEKQRVALSPEQEIALGYESAPQMAAQLGGLSQNERARARVRQVGEGLVARSLAAKSPYKFSFHVLADPRTVNAFALPGGPIFITEGLLRLLKSEAELAGVLGHEIGHVIARHSSAAALRIARRDRPARIDQASLFPHGDSLGSRPPS